MRAEPEPVTDNLPVGSLEEALPHLRRPFAPAAVKFKVQAVWPKKNPTTALIVTYIDARLVIERLNAVAGPRWSTAYVGAGPVECLLTIDGVTRSDIGVGTGPMAAKAARSDALKRAAVHFGVGVSVYALRQAKLTYPDAGARVERRGQGDKETLVLTDAGAVWLRDVYGKWLEKAGEAQFGPVLDHGDEADAQGLDEDTGPAEPEEAALTDDRAVELQAQIQAAYELLRESKGTRFMPPGEFKVRLRRVHHDHAAMEAFLAELTVLADVRGAAA